MAYKEKELLDSLDSEFQAKFLSWKHWQWYSEAAVKGKSSTPYQEGKADYDRGAAAQSISSYLSALPTIQAHPELDGRTLDIVYCFHNIARHFSRWKVTFSALIKLQILHLHVHVLFSVAPLFATRARARACFVFTSSTFALVILRRFRCFCNHLRHVF